MAAVLIGSSGSTPRWAPVVLAALFGLASLGAGAAPTVALETSGAQVCEVPAPGMLSSEGSLTVLAGDVKALTADVRELTARLDEACTRGSVATLAADLATLARRVASLGAQIVEREGSPKAGAAFVPAMPSRDPGSGTAPRASDLYQAAYIDFSRGNYSLAIGAFREFVRRHPHDGLADNAAYWIAEAYFALAHRYRDAGEIERAEHALGETVRAFREVVERYPRGDTAPTALYREALALVEGREPGLSRARLLSLVESFPGSPEARLARDRLAPPGPR